MRINRVNTKHIAYTTFMIVILLASLIISSSVQAYQPNNVDMNIGYVKEAAVNGDKIIVDGKEITIRMYEGIPEEPANGKMFLVALDASSIKGPVESVQEIRIADSQATSFPYDKVLVVEPAVIRVEIPIGGTLSPGISHTYGPYTSAISVSVSVSWTPQDQILGIVLVDAATGQGLGYWYGGGHALVTFTLDPIKKYYILILSHRLNTNMIMYNGEITIYYW